MSSSRSKQPTIITSLLRKLAVCIPVAVLFSVAYAQQPHGPPSDGAKGIPGALGTFILTPDGWKKGTVTYWTDTGDGIDPGTPGCHVEVSETDSKRLPNGRFFGEACTKQGLLIETNPGKDTPHGHKNDQGHPDLFDCNVWCQKAKQKSAGVCIQGDAKQIKVNIPSPCTTSAICSCK